MSTVLTETEEGTPSSASDTLTAKEDGIDQIIVYGGSPFQLSLNVSLIEPKIPLGLPNTLNESTDLGPGTFSVNSNYDVRTTDDRINF